jgi:hypothetical protein
LEKDNRGIIGDHQIIGKSFKTEKNKIAVKIGKKQNKEIVLFTITGVDKKNKIYEGVIE